MHPLQFEEQGTLNNLEAWSQIYSDKIRRNSFPFPVMLICFINLRYYLQFSIIAPKRSNKQNIHQHGVRTMVSKAC